MSFTLRRVFSAFGAGDPERGKTLLYDLVSRLEFARRKHQWKGRSAEYALAAVEGETQELKHAVICNEGPRRVYDEAIDGAVVNLRTAAWEWE